MAKGPKEKDGGSATAIVLSVLLALGAGGLVYYFHDEAEKAEGILTRSKDEYRKMAEEKRPVEEYLRQKRRSGPVEKESTEDLMTFLDKKARESQIPPTIFNISKTAGAPLANLVETSYTVTLQSTKETGLRRAAVVDFLRKVELERRSTKVKALQLSFGGDDLKSATITFSQFMPK